jgi:hypothetical protein
MGIVLHWLADNLALIPFLTMSFVSPRLPPWPLSWAGWRSCSRSRARWLGVFSLTGQGEDRRCTRAPCSPEADRHEVRDRGPLLR